MTRQRRLFSAEFKLEAACLVLDQGYSIPEASHSLNIGETVLRRWIKQLKQERGGCTPASKALTPEQQKIHMQLVAKYQRQWRKAATITERQTTVTASWMREPLAVLE
ncbi:Transposase [Grimontia hollisae]|uniref:Transposase n=1 Tax=Grimontia hollisae TaxID=673 RepID=A0A377HIF3_GRIHO|nr:Transposase [Grimontia hollisae]